MKARLDVTMVERGLARSRAQAADWIRRGRVRVAGQLARKSGQMVAESDPVEIIQHSPYVSRGGEKLAAALAHYDLPVRGGYFLDVGASTGGFTDCLLRNGAARVTALDVGRDQLDAQLRGDARVEVMESINIRDLPENWRAEFYDGAVVDVSFISLRKVLPHVLGRIRPGGWLVTLIKPQFECGPRALNKRGIVTDPCERQAAVERVEKCLLQPGWQVAPPIPSPLTGGSGNTEYLIAAWKDARSPSST